MGAQPAPPLGSRRELRTPLPGEGPARPRAGMAFPKHLARSVFVLPVNVDVTPAKGAGALTPPGARRPFPGP